MIKMLLLSTEQNFETDINEPLNAQCILQVSTTRANTCH